jgi:hypothetical protein
VTRGCPALIVVQLFAILTEIIRKSVRLALSESQPLVLYMQLWGFKWIVARRRNLVRRFVVKA